MAEQQRIKETPAGEETSLQDNDAILVQQDATNDDVFAILSTLSTYIKTKIGNATASVSGFFSSTDKAKLDSFPDTGVANQTLNTDGGGAKVWEPKASGNMDTATYDPGVTGQVQGADEADKISGAVPADALYETDGGSVQQFTAKSSITVGLATNIVGTPGALRTYGTDAGGVKGFKTDASMIVSESAFTRGLVGAKVVEWSGQTTDGVFNEIFIEGVLNARFILNDTNLYGMEFTIIGGKDDELKTFFGKRMLVIKRTGASVSLLGVVETIGTDIVVGVTPDVQFTADVGNLSIKPEVKGIAAETWDWVITGILTKKD